MKYRGIFRIISRPRIFDVSNRCFWRYIPVILFWTLSWNICLRFHSVKICKTFKLSAMQFSRRRYLLCRRCHYVFFLHFSRSVVIFIPRRLLVLVRIIDSVCYRPTSLPPREQSYLFTKVWLSLNLILDQISSSNTTPLIILIDPSDQQLPNFDTILHNSSPQMHY